MMYRKLYQGNMSGWFFNNNENARWRKQSTAMQFLQTQLHLKYHFICRFAFLQYILMQLLLQCNRNIFCIKFHFIHSFKQNEIHEIMKPVLVICQTAAPYTFWLFEINKNMIIAGSICSMLQNVLFWYLFEQRFFLFFY